MALYQVQVSIPYYTGIPEDVVTNVLHFEFGDIVAPTGTDFTNLALSLATFYNGCYGAISPNLATMAKYMRPANARMKMYALADVKPRVPVFDEETPLTALNQDSTSSKLPNEVSSVQSFHGAYVGGISKASQRGRIYLGGLGDGWLDDGDANSFPKPASGALQEATQSAENMLGNTADDGWVWVVRSPTLNQTFDVVGGWMDNAFDTQRRRGQAATTRNLWP